MSDESVSIRLNEDTLGPALAKAVQELEGAQRDVLAVSIANLIHSQAKRAFPEPELRPTEWAAKKDGTPATLVKTGSMLDLLHVEGASIVNAKPYAAIHQFGGTTKPHVIRARVAKALAVPGRGVFKSVQHPGSVIPARPFIPIDADGNLTPTAQDEVNELIKARIERLLGPIS